MALINCYDFKIITMRAAQGWKRGEKHSTIFHMTACRRLWSPTKGHGTVGLVRIFYFSEKQRVDITNRKMWFDLGTKESGFYIWTYRAAFFSWLYNLSPDFHVFGRTLALIRLGFERCSSLSQAMMKWAPKYPAYITNLEKFIKAPKFGLNHWCPGLLKY